MARSARLAVESPLPPPPVGGEEPGGNPPPTGNTGPPLGQAPPAPAAARIAGSRSTFAKGSLLVTLRCKQLKKIRIVAGAASVTLRLNPWASVATHPQIDLKVAR